MSRGPCRLAALTLILLVLTASGCGNPGNGAPDAKTDTRTAAEYFREEQRHTVTTQGKIRSGTVAQEENQIEYQTENGKWWRVTFEQQPDDTYRYGTPAEINK